MKHWESVIELAKERGIVRPRDLRELGIAPENINYMTQQGMMVRLGRGLYSLPSHEWTENHSLVEVARVVPSGVICLLSALRFHEIGTQSPHEVWVAIPRGKTTPPRRRTVVMRSVWFSGRTYTEGIEMHLIEGIEVPIYGIAKTVADIWKFRNKIGMEVAIEALREVLQKRMVTLDELRNYSESARVWNVIRPYVEAMA